MFLRKANSKWIVRTPAKLNVYLALAGRREDGFHELETLMVPIALYDTLVFSPSGTGQAGGAAGDIDFHLVSPRDAKGARGVGPPRATEEVPGDESNLVVRAVEALRRQTGCTSGATITLVKRIPAGAGLGGGSSDAAAALVAANAAWSLDLDRPQLAEIAASLGSDVPFFLTRRAAICTGRGEQVQPLAHRTRLHAVLVTPRERLASGSVYAAVEPQDFTRDEARRTSQRERILDAFCRGDTAGVCGLVHNALERAALSLEPGLARLKQMLVGLGCGRGVMTGSGSSFCFLCRSAAHARRGAAYANSRGLSSAMAVVTCG